MTRETFTEDGWYKTGDIGQWESDGTLSIIDRIKNLVSTLFVGPNDEWDLTIRLNSRTASTLLLINSSRYTKPAVRVMLIGYETPTD